MIPPKPYHEYTDFAFEPGGLRKLDFVVEKIQNTFSGNPQAFNILDVGCGRGNISRPLAYLGYQVTAIDSFQAAIDQFREKDAPQNITVEARAFDSYHSEQKFDVIIMSEVLEHFKKPLAALKRARTLLKDNGIIILTVPNGFSLEETFRRFFGSSARLRSVRDKAKQGIRDKDVKSPANSPHLHFWSAMSIQKLIKSAELDITDFKSAAFLFKEAYYIFCRFFLRRESKLFHWFDKADSGLAKFVPPILASGFIIVAKKNS